MIELRLHQLWPFENVMIVTSRSRPVPAAPSKEATRQLEGKLGPGSTAVSAQLSSLQVRDHHV